MRSVNEIPVFNDIPVLVRAALNVPIKDNKVANDYRLRKALPTLKFLADRGARVVVISHIGEAGTETLAPVAAALGQLIANVSFCESMVGKEARAAVRALPPGHILVMENLRRNPGETGNDPAFARELAELADVFVQDSFDTCHRSHASMVGVPNYLPSYAGFVVQAEVTELLRARTPHSPSLAIIGGAKFATKEPVLSRLVKTYDKVFVGGALANDFLKARGEEVGRSIISNTPIEEIRPLLSNPRIVLPVDGRVVGTDGTERVARVTAFTKDEAMFDHGPETARLLGVLAGEAKTILWNGPLGIYEKGYTACTDAVAFSVAKSKAYSILGGGDTVAEIERIGLLDRFSFVSTGGGAMLDFLAKGTLPGIAALG